ncbi:MAG: DUF485 domain-containing protein [Campylobacterales bacterium]|nr:DUF485 domain-containing protein [Campylobacterales bacterium]
MKQEIVKQIQENLKYQELVKKRSFLAWGLSIAILVVYYVFILVIAFDPSLLGAKMGDGVMTIGIPIGIFIIVFSFVLTGIYVRRANGEFDELSRQIKESVKG